MRKLISPSHSEPVKPIQPHPHTDDIHIPTADNNAVNNNPIISAES